MMNKIRNLMNKPLTVGGLIKLMFWSTIASIVYSVMIWAWMFGWFNKAAEKLSDFFGKFSKKAEPVEEQ